MAIYVGLKLEEQDEDLRVYSFFRSNGSPYGRLAVDIRTEEVVLLEALDDRAEWFAFPRACRALERSFRQGELPDELCFAA